MTNKQLYVGNLSYQVTEQDLKDFFENMALLNKSEWSELTGPEGQKALVLLLIDSS